MRRRRKEAARRSPKSFKPKKDQEAPENFDSNTLKIAENLLQEIELKSIPMSIYTFSERLGIRVSLLCQQQDIYDRLSLHNSRYSSSIIDIFEAQLQDLRKHERVVSQEEFAQMCGTTTGILLRAYPIYLQRLNEQNRTLRNEYIHREAEKHLLELQTTAKGQSVGDFARYLRTDEMKLRTQHADIVNKLVLHNKSVNLTAISYQERDVPEQTEARLASAFAEVERSNKEVTIQDFAGLAGVSWGKLSTFYPHWKDRLDECNRRLISARLQAAWDRMESSNSTWTCKRLAAEAEIDPQLLRKSYKDWIKRLKEKAVPTIERLRTVIEKAKRSSKLVSLAEVAEEANLSLAGIRKSYPELCKSLIEHNKIAFRPTVEAVWETVCETDTYPSLSEFAKQCNFQYVIILTHYFPDVVERI